MTNYELALELLDRGMADKHHTFNCSVKCVDERPVIVNRRRGR